MHARNIVHVRGELSCMRAVSLVDQHDDDFLESFLLSPFWSTAVFQTPLVSIALFLLPLNCPLQLHNHPGIVVLSKVFVGALQARILSPLGPPDPNESKSVGQSVNSDARSSDDDPGVTALPLAERLLDVFSVPTTSGTTCDVASQYDQLAKSERLSERSSLRRRLIVGSRIRRQMGEAYDCLELFNGVVDSDTQRAQRPSSTGVPRPTNRVSSVGSSGSRTREVRSSSSLPSPMWDSIVPNEKWPTTLLCTPCYGNLHRFESSSDFVLILDLISPSYGVPKARDCQYLTTHSNTSSESTREEPRRDEPSSHVGLDAKKHLHTPQSLQGYPRVKVQVTETEFSAPDLFIRFQLQV